MLLYFLPALCVAQGVGRSIINQTFGENVINPAAPLPVTRTGYEYTTDSCPAAGFYTITNSLYRCEASRMGRSLDNTPSSNYGNMMLFNTPGSKDITVYTDTVSEALCPGTTYQFSAWLLNASIPANCNESVQLFPKFTLSVETLSGTVVQSISTGAMGYDYDPVFVPKFHFFHADFTMPASVNQLVLKITSNQYSNTCSYLFALDDISFAAAGPAAEIFFAGAPTAIITTACFQDNKTISMHGSVDDYYQTKSLQWQQSRDSGLTWRDISGATSDNYTETFSVADTFLFRLSAAEQSKIANINCRVVSNILKVEVTGSPDKIKVVSNSPVCVGVDVVFDAETGNAIHYEWHGPNGYYDDAYYPRVNHTQLKDSGMYYVTVTILGGCKITDSTYVKVYGAGAVTAGNDTAICLGSSARLHGPAGASVRWSPGNSLSDTTIADPVAKPEATTVYTVSVNDNAVCVSTATVKVIVKNTVIVKAAFSAPEFICRPRDTVAFVDASEGVIDKWHWDFGNGQQGLTEDTAIIYNVASNAIGYNVMLAVRDTAGCADTTYQHIMVADNCYMAVPTAFTPNGDGLNDYLYPVNAYKAKDIIFRVYNRNGQLVFLGKSRTQKWDGRVNGLLQPTGVYVWTFDYTDDAGKKVSLKGTATLIR